MIVEYVGGPVDGRMEHSDGPLDEFRYLPHRSVARFVKLEDPGMLPLPVLNSAHRYRLRDVVDGVAFYVFVREH